MEPRAFRIWTVRSQALRIRRALLFCDGDRQHAAKLLGMNRNTMYLILETEDRWFTKTYLEP